MELKKKKKIECRPSFFKFSSFFPPCLVFAKDAHFYGWQGLFTWREKEPCTGKVREGGTTFCWVNMQKFWSVWLLSREQKDGGRRQQSCNLGPSSLVTTVHNYLLAATGSSLQLVMPNEIVGLLSWLPTILPATNFVWFVPSIGARIFFGNIPTSQLGKSLLQQGIF